jgi:hypothetical protein
MPIHIESLTSDVTMFSGELPLTEAQVGRLVSLVLKRLEDCARDAERSRGATKLRRQAYDALEGGE